MTYMPRLHAATTADWPDLVAELDRWGEAGRVASLWWRDDDATVASPKLANLLRLAREAPVALAVIPALAQEDLADALRGTPSVAVLQHGWRHANQAAQGKKSEYPNEREPAMVAVELAAGRARLAELFGPRARPVFVPPWNRFAPALLPALVDSGVAALSTMALSTMALSTMAASTKAGQAPVCLPRGLAAIDVHVDVTDWKGNRGFIGTAAALGALTDWLRARRLADDDAARPIGILTHHLVMDDATAAFLDCLVALVGAHAAARWTSVAEFLR
jgi:peptidoglycan/xylan/chitin deacetylase (PgdA/CDA1 family)